MKHVFTKTTFVYLKRRIMLNKEMIIKEGLDVFKLRIEDVISKVLDIENTKKNKMKVIKELKCLGFEVKIIKDESRKSIRVWRYQVSKQESREKLELIITKGSMINAGLDLKNINIRNMARKLGVSDNINRLDHLLVTKILKGIGFFPKIVKDDNRKSIRVWRYDEGEQARQRGIRSITITAIKKAGLNIDCLSQSDVAVKVLRIERWEVSIKLFEKVGLKLKELGFYPVKGTRQDWRFIDVEE